MVLSCRSLLTIPCDSGARLARWLAGACLGVFLAGPLQAGLSSENVIVVVNGDSKASRTIANHYVELRQIPSRNVILLEDVPEGVKTDLDSFRDKILKPVLAQLDARGIARSARVIAYSAGFPTAVTINAHHEKLTDETTKKYQRPIASLTGLTYFYRYVLADNPSYLGLGANLYARGKFDRHFINPFSGELKSDFEQASELVEAEKFAEAAEAWKALHETMPSIASLAIRAAEAYSQDGQDEQAVEMILAAVKNGWWSATYLEQTPELEKHLNDAKLARLIPLLDDSPIAWQGPVPFASNVGWTSTGSRAPIEKGGMPYLCACSLAVLHPHGSTLPGAIRVLRRASKADRTFPSGRFAFTASADVRAKTRFRGIADAAVYLQEHGHETEIFRDVLPSKPGPLAGLMVGTSNANLLDQPWLLVRGAVAENLTSLGGAFDTGSQTKLTEFLAAGAAMSCGAVAEPYSLQPKFPTPMLYAYYARGLSAIEAFYQTITSPYQLLIVGDPLTQPFAKAPDELVDIEFESGEQATLRLSRRGLGLKAPKSKTRSIEILIEGRSFQTTPPVPNVKVNWPANTAGVYDVRVTLTGLDRTEPRVTFMQQIDVQGERPAPTAEVTQPRTGAEGLGNNGATATPIEVSLECPGADRIEVTHLGETVASIEGEEGTATISTEGLGGGPLRFRPVAHFDDAKVRGRTFVDQPETDQ
jgi:hypothetical protein